MSTTTMVSESQTPPNRAGRLRRLSQLRAYTQSHLIPSSSSSASSTAPTSPPSAGNPRRHRNSLSRVVSLSSPFHISIAPESTQQPLPAAASASSSSPEREASQTDNSTNSDSDPREQPVSSDSSRSLPLSQGGSAQAADSEVQSMAVVDNSATAGGQDSNAPATSATTDARTVSDNKKPKMSNTIRFFAYQDTHNSSRPSLQFSPVTRTLPSEDCVIRVGRYSERDGIPIANPSEPSDAPIGFKSKVVSRKHCEFSIVNGQWHIKDVGSSSGTFLNRTRLSQPNMASRLYAVRDGDIVQLGIDFRGGEEMIFRCVRIRIECNRTWQQRPNQFNKNTETLINNLGKGKAASDFEGCRECSICLGSVLRPYQCLFMAACAHVWHYKCIRRLIHTPDYPMFQCPNCRAWTDLSAEVDDSMEFDEESAKEDTDAAETKADAAGNVNGHSTTATNADCHGEQSQAGVQGNDENTTNDRELAAIAGNLNLGEGGNMPVQDDATSGGAKITSREPVSINSQSANIPIPNGSSSHSNQANYRSNTPTFEDDPMTPRNDTGPLALDGRAGRL